MSERPTEADAEAYIRGNLPLAATMDVRVVSLGLDPLAEHGPILTAPLEVNANHLGTAFGGSIATLAILTGWAAVHYGLLSEGLVARTVVQRTTMEYLDPAEADLRATCAAIDEGAWERLLRGVVRHGRGRTSLQVDVVAAGRPVARFEGAYVAMKA